MNRLLQRALVVLGFLTVLVCGFHALINADYWFHLRMGETILDEGSVPRLDRWSQPAAGQRYLDIHWLFQVALRLVHGLGGVAAAVWFKCGMLLGTFFVLYRLARRSAPPGLAGFLVGVGAILASDRFLVRPELFSFCFLVVLQLLLTRHGEGARRAWWGVPVVMLAWANSQGLFVLGFLPIAVFLMERPRDRRLWSAAGLSVLAVFCNPNVIDGAMYPFVQYQLMRGHGQLYSETIAELRGTFSGSGHVAVWLFPWYLGALGLALLARGKWPRLREVLLVVPFVVLALQTRRNVALLPLVSVPVLAAWIGAAARRPEVQEFWRAWPPPVRALGSIGVPLLGALALTAYGTLLVTNRMYVRTESMRAFGAGPAEAAFPEEATRFLCAQQVEGALFNDLSSGSYVLWACPEQRVFMDGRLEVYTPEQYARYFQVIAGGEAWAEAAREFGFGVVLVRYVAAPQLTQQLLRDPGWALVHLDDVAAVFVREIDAHESLVSEHAVTPERMRATFPSLPPTVLAEGDLASPRTVTRVFERAAYPWSEINLGQFFLRAGESSLAGGQFLRAVERHPGLMVPRVLLASSLNQLERSEEALAMLDSARDLAGGHEDRLRAQAVRADVLLVLARYADAIVEYRDYLEQVGRGPQSAVAVVNLAQARLESGDATGAASDLRQALSLAPGYPRAYEIAGRLEEARGNVQGALAAYEQCARLGGTKPRIDEAIARLRAIVDTEGSADTDTGAGRP